MNKEVGGISRIFSNLNTYRIISPFTINDVKNLNPNVITYDVFVSKIMQDDSFAKLVDYVKDNNINSNITKEEIINKYKDLIKEYYDMIKSEPYENKFTTE